MSLTQMRIAMAASIAWVGIGVSGALAQSAPKYTTAEVVSVNAQQRLLVVRGNDGAQQTLELDDQVSGLAELRAGDRVILTMRGEPGRARVQAFSKTTKVAARASTPAEPVVTASDRKDGTALDRGDEELRAAESYSQRLADLAAQATAIDTVWSGFRTACNVTLSDGAYAGSREWLSLWESVQVDTSSGYCRDLFNQIVGRGQSVNAAMAAAETDARRSLEPGAIREIQRQYSLEWHSWGSTPPKRLEQ